MEQYWASETWQQKLGGLFDRIFVVRLCRCHRHRHVSTTSVDRHDILVRRSPQLARVSLLRGANAIAVGAIDSVLHDRNGRCLFFGRALLDRIRR